MNTTIPALATYIKANLRRVYAANTLGIGQCRGIKLNVNNFNHNCELNKRFFFSFPKIFGFVKIMVTNASFFQSPIFFLCALL